MDSRDNIPSQIEIDKFINAHPERKHDAIAYSEIKDWIKANPNLGMKFDGGKVRWSLILGGCIKGLRGILAVLEFGAKKYAANSWQNVEAARYQEALSRHFMDIQEHGLQHIDSDSGLLSIYHLGCDALFLAHFATTEGERQAREATR